MASDSVSAGPLRESASATAGTVISSDGAMESNTQVTDGSACNNQNGTDTSSLTCDKKVVDTLQFASELAERGTEALQGGDYGEAAECFSRALEIRVSHHGELAVECFQAYCQYGRALLCKAQEDADPLVTVPEKESEYKKDTDNCTSPKRQKNGESSVASVSSNAEDGISNSHVSEDNVSVVQDAENDSDQSDDEDGEDVPVADEEENDLDLAWKTLDVARAIAEKHFGDTLDKADVLSTLAEVALEREDIETSLNDYKEAIAITEKLVEPDSRRLAELYFRVCLCLEVGAQPQEAVRHCEKALSICRSRMHRLTNEVTKSVTSSASEVEDDTRQSATDKGAEIETLSHLSNELEKKLEDLQQLPKDPKFVITEMLGIAAASAFKGPTAAMNSSQVATANSNGGIDSPTLSTARTVDDSCVTNLGVVGRGVKRVVTSVVSSESSPSKKPVTQVSSERTNGGT